MVVWWAPATIKLLATLYGAIGYAAWKSGQDIKEDSFDDYRRRNNIKSIDPPMGPPPPGKMANVLKKIVEAENEKNAPGVAQALKKFTGGPTITGAIHNFFYKKKYKAFPKAYIGVGDMDHFDDTQIKIESTKENQAIQDVFGFLTKTKIQSSGLGIDDFIDINTADSRAEGLNYLLRKSTSTIYMKNFRETGVHCQMYVVVCRKDCNNAPTIFVQEGLASEVTTSVGTADRYFLYRLVLLMRKMVTILFLGLSILESSLRILKCSISSGKSSRIGDSFYVLANLQSSISLSSRIGSSMLMN